MATKPGNTPLPRPKQEHNELNPLLPAILATVVLCSIVTTVCTAIRLIRRRFISKYDLDDYMLIAAWVSSIAFAFCLLAAGLAGFGHHALYLPRSQYAILDKYTWVLELLYPPAMWLAKASLLFQQIRIFAPTKSRHVYWACHVLIWANLAFYVAVFFAVIFQCRPVWEVWNPDDHGHNVNWRMLLVVSSAINMVSDLLTLLLPIWATWYLQIALGKRAGIVAVVAAGLLAFSASICRLVYTARLRSTRDVFYVAAQTEMWGLAELATLILCICLPMLFEFIERVHDRRSTPPASPVPRKPVRKSKILKIDGGQNSVGFMGAVREVDMDFLKSPYEQLGEVEDGKGDRRSVVRELGKKRTVGIEMASRDQLNAKSRVASMA